MTIWNRVVHGEPLGWGHASLYFVTALVSFCLYGYSLFFTTGGTVVALFFGAAFGLMGAAETPATTRRVAGILRVAALGIWLLLLALTLTDPALLWGT
ncbi:hypothetical protein [Natrarchaeobaculum aegyptiacum]|uniref:Uncharacterized protein n=1 Tax=Natrarchaeobaculum aegyptiacum TaxID=745377 RepID=A0A2Z2HPD5_9EURY|nr:hypothetical protein [Natrarchaeobaculum aegyptiacum]ARS88879.1 hypothetical protein B1756_03325 [Natrarchaeobaculum aegyptiacum]